MEGTQLNKKIAQIYHVDIRKTEAIFADICFYADFFKSATMSRRKPWKRVADFLLLEYGIHMSGQTVKRWHNRVLGVKRKHEKKTIVGR